MLRKLLLTLLVGIAGIIASESKVQAHGWGHWAGRSWGCAPAYRYGGWSGVSFRTHFYSPSYSCYRPVYFRPAVSCYRPIVSCYRPRVISYCAPLNFGCAYSPGWDYSYSSYVPVCTTNYAPIHYPAETLYGPQANQQFWGQPSYSLNQPATANVLTTAAQLLQMLQAGKQLQPQTIPAANRWTEYKTQPSLPLARSRARTAIAVGDRYFREQRYHDAVQKYRDAVTAAGDYAEAHFRLGHAYTATGRIEEAATAFRRGTMLTDDITREGFQLETLYGNAHIAKRSHIESAAAAALEDPTRSDLLLVVGLFLHYDGQPERAAKFFTRSLDLGENPAVLAAYLNLQAKPEAPTVLQVNAKVTTDEI